MIEKGLQEFKYANTSNIQFDVMKLLLKISGKLGANNDLRQKVEELTSYIETLMGNYDLMNKEIYSSQPVPAQVTKQGSD